MARRPDSEAGHAASRPKPRQPLRRSTPTTATFTASPALAADITSMTTNLSGTPTHGRNSSWDHRHGDASDHRALSFESSTATLPTTTTARPCFALASCITPAHVQVVLRGGGVMRPAAMIVYGEQSGIVRRIVTTDKSVTDLQATTAPAEHHHLQCG